MIRTSKYVFVSQIANQEMYNCLVVSLHYSHVPQVTLLKCLLALLQSYVHVYHMVMLEMIV